MPILAEAALERDIRDLGNKAVHARAAGDIVKARELIDRMYRAIASRTPEHRARLEREALARVDADPCYFSAIGEMHRERGQR